jgi:PKD repeat protein
MKKACQAVLIAAFGLTGGIAAAQPYTTVYPPGDLIIGFTTGYGTDEMVDLGRESSLTNGMTWNLASLLSSYGNFTGVNWGVIGNGTNAGTPRVLWTTTVVGTVPDTITGNAAFGHENTATTTLYYNFSSGGPGKSAAIAASSSVSWNTETLSGTLATDYLNCYENPNVVGATTADFSQVLNDASDPTLLGRFTLSANGIVTFNTVSNSPTAPTASFTGTPTSGTAPLKVVFSDASSGSITNWLWSFGDGHSLTNTSNANVTNTYAAAGSYTVTLTVAGSGGTNALTQANYIVVSTAAASVPKIYLAMLSNGQLVISGTNGTASAQYRILSSTNLTSGTWTPVFTNSFLSSGGFAYTNSVLTSGAAYFRLVSP